MINSNPIKDNSDVVIVGGGIVGLCIAYQIKKKCRNLKITLLDKEEKLGLHSSGRNSGVLHAGIYYKPNTLRAKVCIEGSKRLKEWCEEQSIDFLKCGKVITPQKQCFDDQIDLLYDRGKANGAEVSIINEAEFNKLVPDGRTASGRALWSPNTSVVNSLLVVNRLRKLLVELGVKFLFNCSISNVDLKNNKLLLSNNNNISFGYLFNTAGLSADKVSKLFGVGTNLTLLPIKGIYWRLSPEAPFKFSTNLYPVPDLNVPFLGVHVTPSPSGNVFLGPTAIPAWGRENYKGLEGFDLMMSGQTIYHLFRQFMSNNNGFRKYTYQQALLGIKPLFFRAARELIPALQIKHLLPSEKVGIRAQLYDTKKCSLIDDFYIENTNTTTHVLNAISPAFTSSFSLADLIIKSSNF